MNRSGQELLIVDFDRTVFDSDSLYEDLYELCEAYGINRDSLDPSLAFVPPDNLLFNFFLMVQRNQRIEPAILEKVVAEMQSYIRTKGHLYVFDDSRPFLDSAIKSGWKVAILTHGDLSFQIVKFVGSKLSNLCHSFTVTSVVKWRHMENVSASTIIFLDDNPNNIDEVKMRFPEVLAVEVKRQDSKYQTVLSTQADLVVGQLEWPIRLYKKG